METVVVSTSRYEVGRPSRVSGGFRQPRAPSGTYPFRTMVPNRQFIFSSRNYQIAFFTRSLNAMRKDSILDLR